VVAGKKQSIKGSAAQKHNAMVQGKERVLSAWNALSQASHATEVANTFGDCKDPDATKTILGIICAMLQFTHFSQ